MNNHPILSTDLLRPYFRNMHFIDEKYKIDVEIFSDINQIAFEISLACKEPIPYGSFPQRRFSFERHADSGHKGVHIQINYHLVDNEMDLGRLYISLEVSDDEELLDIAEGFVFTLYEVIQSINEDMEEITEYIFNLDIIDSIRDKKGILIEKMVESLRNNRIQISNTRKEITTVIDGAEFISLLEERKELVPLIGPVVDYT